MKWILFLPLLVGCGGGPNYRYHWNRIVGEDGKKDWYAISCHKEFGICLKLAGDLCPNGYVIHDQNRVGRNSILIKCK